MVSFSFLVFGKNSESNSVICEHECRDREEPVEHHVSSSQRKKASKTEKQQRENKG